MTKPAFSFLIPATFAPTAKSDVETVFVNAFSVHLSSTCANPRVPLVYRGRLSGMLRRIRTSNPNNSDEVRAREMRISTPHDLSATGEVELIGNPLKLSRTPVSYRRAPPVCGADTDDVIQELNEINRD